MAGDTGDGQPPAKRRRIFLQTMGQQLREAGLSNDELPENSASLATGASGFYFIRSVYGGLQADRASRRQAQIQTPESDVVPGEDGQLPTGAAASSTRFLWGVNEVSTSTESGHFSFDDLIEWTRTYFDNWHPAYPFLHAPSMLEYFDDIAQHGLSGVDETGTFELIMLRAIMSISLADRRQTGFAATHPVPAFLIFNSFNDAIRSIERSLTDETSIQSLQAVVGVQLFLLSMLRYNAASRLEGLAIRMAVQLGLHRCPKRISSLSEKEMELRKRLFWSIYCIDRYICSRLGLPLAIRDDDIDVCYPGEEHHGQGSHEHDSRLNLLSFLARHAEIRGSIMQLRNTSTASAEAGTDHTVVINTTLTKWWNEVDECLESNDDNSGSPVLSPFHQITLAVLRQESVIALNRSILGGQTKLSAYDEALHNCIGAARAVINTLHKALNGGQASAGSPSTPLLWPSFTWAVWMSAFLLIHAAAEDQISRVVATRFADRSLEILKHLAVRGSIWPNACAVALRTMRDQMIDRKTSSSAQMPDGRHATASAAATADSAQRPHNPSLPRRSTNHSGTATPSQSSTRTRDLQSSDIAFLGHAQRPPLVGAGEMMSSQPYVETISDPQSSHNGYPLRNPSTVRTEDTSLPMNSHQHFALSDASHSADFQQWENMPACGHHLLDPNQMFNQDGTDLFYGSEIPFWMGDDQWGGLGGGGWS